MNDFEFNNLVKAIELCMKQNYCAMYYDDLIKKFYPEISYEEFSAAIDAMYECDRIVLDGTLLRLVVQ